MIRTIRIFTLPLMAAAILLLGACSEDENRRNVVESHDNLPQTVTVQVGEAVYGNYYFAGYLEDGNVTAFNRAESYAQGGAAFDIYVQNENNVLHTSDGIMLIIKEKDVASDTITIEVTD